MRKICYSIVEMQDEWVNMRRPLYSNNIKKNIYDIGPVPGLFECPCIFGLYLGLYFGLCFGLYFGLCFGKMASELSIMPTLDVIFTLGWGDYYIEIDSDQHFRFIALWKHASECLFSSNPMKRVSSDTSK